MTLENRELRRSPESIVGLLGGLDVVTELSGSWTLAAEPELPRLLSAGPPLGLVLESAGPEPEARRKYRPHFGGACPRLVRGRVRGKSINTSEVGGS